MSKNIQEVKEMIKNNKVSVVAGALGVGKIALIEETLLEMNVSFKRIHSSQLMDENDLFNQLAKVRLEKKSVLILDELNRLHGDNEELVREIIKLIRSNEFRIVVTTNSLNNELSDLVKWVTEKYSSQELVLSIDSDNRWGDYEFLKGIPTRKNS